MPHVKKEMISFFLTSLCPLRCIYCYNSQKRKSEPIQTLDLNFAKAGIDYFFGNFQSRHIRFYGPGEPTQAFSLMQQIRDYAYSKVGEELSLELQTNGAFSENVRNWLSENANIIWVSFDGTPDIHDKKRPFPNNVPSSPIIESNVKYLSSNLSKTGIVGVRVTITNDNMLRQLEMIDYFVSLGIKHIWCDPLFQEVMDFPVCMNPERQENFHFNMEEFVNTYVEAYQYAKSIGVFYGTNLIYNFDGCSEYNCRACLPLPHLTPDGYVSACDMVTFGGKAKHMEPLVYGKWDGENIQFYEDRIEVLRSRKSCNMPACANCEVSNKCAGYCLGETLNETGSLFGNIPKVCYAIRKLYQEIGPITYEYFHP